MKNIILHLFLVLLCRNLVIAQSNYVQLADMSGYNTGTGNIATLADEANAALPEIYRSFKVIDFGYYIHNGEQGLTEEIMANAETQAASESPYFLLVGKESNPEGVLNRFTVKLKIPLVANCLSQEDVDIKAQELENLLNNENTGPTTYITNLAKATADLRDYFKYMTDSCCYAGISGFTGEMCSGIMCNVPSDFLPQLNFTNDDLKFFKSHDEIVCKAYNLYNNPVQLHSSKEVKKAMIKTAMLMAKDAYSLYFNRIKIRGSLDLEYYFRAGGLSDYLFQYDQKKAKYHTIFNSLYEECGGLAFGSQLNAIDFLIEPLAALSEITCQIAGQFESFLNTIRKLSREDIQLICYVLVGVAATIAFAVLMPKLSDLQSLVEAASSIAAGNVFWGAVDIITTIAGYVPWGKVWKSIGELVKAVGPLRKFYLAIDKYGSAGMAKLRKYLNEKRGRATYEDGKVKISNPDGTKIDAEDVVRAGKVFKKPYTKDNFRDNLAILTDEIPANSQAHHVFPQQTDLAQFFQSKGIDIHDPVHGTWWPTPAHQQKAYEYNLKWKEWIDENRFTNKEQVLKKGRELMKDYGFKVNF
ncbi:MAG: DUF2380 domain-containing protein [Saprospiraceae bacterium]|nr:DUF2380 domain-containing protein [Saprospiraceae bacterium]